MTRMTIYFIQLFFLLIRLFSKHDSERVMLRIVFGKHGFTGGYFIDLAIFRYLEATR